MPAHLLPVLAALALAAGPPPLKPLKSGPQVGARNDRSGLLPKFVAGPAAGQHLCPV